MIVELWTDGAIHKNGRPEAVGGWACIMLAKQNGEIVREKEMSGAKRAPGTTSNEMELRGVLEGLTTLAPGHAGRIEVHVYTDSEYVQKGFDFRADRWAHEGWKPRANLEIIKQIYDLSKKFLVHYHWVPGHAGHKYNERADELAVEAKEKEMGIR
ncbi:ribonuclease H family protein (plasmid) [Paenibacillus sp. S-38]|uniref:ribonuclease H family protein n=1 Tax=Paenibacillus sp. S-38 TaxID=3416710 RepID=UPI003CF6321F